jgi:hypothetical protein
MSSTIAAVPRWEAPGRPTPCYERPPHCDQDLTFVAYDDERLPWTLAAQDVIVLRGCTPVDVSELVTAGALT